MKSTLNYSYLIFFLALISIEVFCIFQSYANYGWTMPILLSIIASFNILPILFFFIFKKEIAATICALIIGILIIPDQLYLMVKHIKLKEEVANISNYVYQRKLKVGEFPANINDYNFVYPNLKKDIFYTCENRTFMIRYSVGTHSTTHWFDSGRMEKWSYYDD